MPTPAQTKAVSLLLSLLVAAVAGALMWRQARERRARDPELSPPDERHFRQQDHRRTLGALVLLILAVGLSVGSRLPHKVGGHSNPAFLLVWLAVFLLIFLLLSLALFDLLATRIYARRHQRAILRERLDVIREEAERRSLRNNGPSPPGNGAPH